MPQRLLYNLFTLLIGLGLLTAVILHLSLPPTAASGSLRFVDEQNVPLAYADLRLLCYASATAHSPLLTDLPARTNTNGYLTHPLPANCSYLTALWLRHTQPSGKAGHGPAYWVYATSWQPGSTERQPATGDIQLVDSHPLVLFNVVASLAWQPAANSPYVAQLQTGLRQMSAYLYDLTEGQMAVGAVTIHADGRHWESADLRFLTANDYRPTAYMGGIVPAATPYTAPATLSQTVYAPGGIYLGRYWDGLDAADPVSGHWAQPAAYRTLAHEWGHYALFLYDEYQQNQPAGKQETYCTCLALPTGACAASAMAYHYTAVALWHSTEHGSPSVCQQTDQMLVHGEADWATLQRWGDIQQLAGDWLQPPALPLATQTPDVVDDLFGHAPGYRLYLPALANSGTAVPTPTEPTIHLTLDGSFTPAERNALYPQVYLAQDGRVQYQGTSDSNRTLPASAGYITLLGVPPTGRAVVYAEQYTTDATTGGRFIYPTPGSNTPPLTNGSTLLLTAASWEASLDVTYGMIGPLLTAMTVTLTSPATLPTPPVAQRCSPDAAVGCPASVDWRQTMTAVNANTWTAVFTAPSGQALPKYGLVGVQAGSTGELWRWFQSLGGVGPAHDDGQAPLLDGLAMVAADTVNPKRLRAVPGTTNQAILMPAADYDALTAPLPPGFAAIVGTAVDLDVLLPVPNTPWLLTLFYPQTAVDRLGLNEAQLELLHYSRALNQWQVVAVSGRSPLLNWLASGPVVEDGIYAVGWRSVPPPVADFDGLPQNGPAPLPVNFINLSEGEYDSSLWDFGDGVTSALTNPLHMYEMPGVYTVTLAVSGPGGNDTLIKPDFIVVMGTNGEGVKGLDWFNLGD
ncbi:MAG: PKD domain-containing protein [Anaerolineae bacterium]|nr:PKD domain-containing protein [Anaerolineae bacterium]